jgi:beta-ureidopropionase / N-carbamoyl-L-amino-acid hydrolase
MNQVRLEINAQRMMQRLHALAAVGQTADGSCCRVALTDEDRAGRDLVVQWMTDLGLQVSVDPIGNIFGYRPGQREDLAPVMTGSHIDTVRTGGIYDGNYGVLAGLEIVECLNEAKQHTQRGLVVAIFTNEEGVRFTPDMLGSLVYADGMALSQALALTDKQGIPLGAALEKIGYAGTAPLGIHRPMRLSSFTSSKVRSLTQKSGKLGWLNTYRASLGKRSPLVARPIMRAPPRWRYVMMLAMRQQRS